MSRQHYPPDPHQYYDPRHSQASPNYDHPPRPLNCGEQPQYSQQYPVPQYPYQYQERCQQSYNNFAIDNPQPHQYYSHDSIGSHPQTSHIQGIYNNNVQRHKEQALPKEHGDHQNSQPHCSIVLNQMRSFINKKRKLSDSQAQSSSKPPNIKFHEKYTAYSDRGHVDDVPNRYYEDDIDGEIYEERVQDNEYEEKDNDIYEEKDDAVYEDRNDDVYEEKDDIIDCEDGDDIEIDDDVYEEKDDVLDCEDDDVYKDGVDDAIAKEGHDEPQAPLNSLRLRHMHYYTAWVDFENDPDTLHMKELVYASEAGIEKAPGTKNRNVTKFWGPGRYKFKISEVFKDGSKGPMKRFRAKLRDSAQGERPDPCLPHNTRSNVIIACPHMDRPQQTKRRMTNASGAQLSFFRWNMTFSKENNLYLPFTYPSLAPPP